MLTGFGRQERILRDKLVQALKQSEKERLPPLVLTPHHCLTESVPLRALHQQVNTRKLLSLPSHNSKFSSPNLVTNGLTSPLRQAQGMSTQADVKTEQNNLGTTPFKHMSMASGSERGQLRVQDKVAVVYLHWLIRTCWAELCLTQPATIALHSAVQTPACQGSRDWTKSVFWEWKPKVWSNANSIGITGEHQLPRPCTAEDSNTQKSAEWGLMIRINAVEETVQWWEYKIRRGKNTYVLSSQGKHKSYAVVALVDQYSDYISKLRKPCPVHDDQSHSPGYLSFTWIQAEYFTDSG